MTLETNKIIIGSKELIPHHREIIIATNFLYREYIDLPHETERDIENTDGIRGDLALQMIQSAINRGVRVVAADGGSSSAFLTALKSFEGHGLTLIHSQKPGLAPQRRDAFHEISTLTDAEVIIYMQPEKVMLIDFIEKLIQPILNDETDIVIPARNKALFKKSYPDYMVESEEKVNDTYNRLLQRKGLLTGNLDWFFGPIIFHNNPDIISLFLEEYQINNKGIPSRNNRARLQPNSETYSGNHYFPIIKALWERKRVMSVEVPFKYPENQKENESAPQMRAVFEERRRKDAAAYRLELLHFLALLENKENNILYVGSSQ